MKNVKALIFQLRLVAFSAVFLALAAFGCNESLQSRGSPETISIDSLVPEAMRVIREGLADEEPQIRARAIEVVAETQRLELMPPVVRLLNDDFVPVRFAAALAVGDTKYQLAKDSVRQLLRAPDENTRIAAAYAMKKLGYPKSFRILGKAITSRDQTVRANAAVLLGKSGDKSTMDLLYWAKDDEKSDPKVRFQAAEAIARLGDERIYPRLWTMLISKYIENRIMGIKAMGALGTAEAKNALILKLNDSVLEIRLAAAEQLGMLGYDTGEPEVLDVFVKNLTAGLNETERERVKVLTALAIGQIGTEQLKKFVPQLLKDKSKSVRIAAAKAVFQWQMAG